MANHPRNILVTGLPRGGTTLTCKLLTGLPDTIALHEPMDIGRWLSLNGMEAIYAEIDDFFAKNRESLLRDGTVMTKHVNGAIPDNPFAAHFDEKGLRPLLEERGMVKIEKPLSADFTFIIKHPAAFTAVLKDLKKRYECYALIRNPLSVLASWQSVDMPVNRGRVPMAEALDPELKGRLDATPGVLERQLVILDWYCERFHRLLPTKRIVRYEDVVASGGKVLAKVAPIADRFEQTLESRNRNQLYDWEMLQTLGERLLATEGYWWRFYTPEDIREVMTGVVAKGGRDAVEESVEEGAASVLGLPAICRNIISLI
ncbi:MAG: hypothetical protein QM796_10665 [Chthoniobacteraceae bacterium]